MGGPIQDLAPACTLLYIDISIIHPSIYIHYAPISSQRPTRRAYEITHLHVTVNGVTQDAGEHALVSSSEGPGPSPVAMLAPGESVVGVVEDRVLDGPASGEKGSKGRMFRFQGS